MCVAVLTDTWCSMKQLLTRNEVLKRTSLSRATLFRYERAGLFPKAVRLSANRVAYDADSVDGWIENILNQDRAVNGVERQATALRQSLQKGVAA